MYLKCFIAALLLFIAQKSFSQQADKFEIDGDLKGLKDGEAVKLILFHNRIYEPADSGFVKNGKFTIVGHVADGPHYYELYFPSHRNKMVRLLINNAEKISIHGGDIDKIDHQVLDSWISVEGSNTNLSKLVLIPVYLGWYQNTLGLNNYLAKIKDSVGFDGSLVSGILSARDIINQRLLQGFLLDKDPMYTPAIPYILYLTAQTSHESFLVDAYNGLDEQAKNSFYGKICKQQVLLCVGQHFPGFSLLSGSGDSIILDKLVVKNKLTLVHFWAVNSYIRSQYQDELRFFYKKYQNKGLGIVGVSSDDSEHEYKKFVKDQAFPWPNVSDFMGADGIVGKVYHEVGDPTTHNTTNVLIDANGKIVAWDPTGVELQWYLRKYLGE